MPIGILSLALVQWLLVEPQALERERRERLRGGLKVDWVGFVLVALWLGCLEIVLDKGQREDWFQSSFIIGFARSRRSPSCCSFRGSSPATDPIVELRLMGRRQFLGLLPDDADGRRLDVQHHAIPAAAAAGEFPLHRDAVGPRPDAGRARHAGHDADRGAAHRYRAAQISHGARDADSRGRHVAPDLAAAGCRASIISPGRGSIRWSAMPFLFVPITTVSYADLPPEKTNQASALINVARNLGGSIGVSMAITVLAQRSQLHQLRLTEHLVPSSPQYQSSLQQAASHFAAQGATRPDAQHQAIGWLGQLVQDQSVAHVLYRRVLDLRRHRGAADPPGIADAARGRAATRRADVRVSGRSPRQK